MAIKRRTGGGARRKAGKQDAGGRLRVRMYRVGFGDFFLLTVPSAEGPQHVLIDCGVTKGTTGNGDIGSIKEAVAHMARETERKLALIVVTHRHMDHIIGFSRCAEEFKQFRVGAIWMPYWETEYDAEISGFQAALTALALDVQSHLALAADGSSESAAMLAMLENATGTPFGLTGTGGGSNAASLALLKGQLGVKPVYCHIGQTPELPKELADAGLEAEVLGPPPKDATAFMKLKDLKKGVGQYLEASERRSAAGGAFRPFGEEWRGSASDYPPEAFREWAPRVAGVAPDFRTRHHKPLEQAVQDAQPGVLLTAVKQLDAFLNNQSLVVLFTYRGKKLLFAGDAQAGNWEYWLYDGDQPSKTPAAKLGTRGASVLGQLDFYKVGHHGSTNATPITAVAAMNPRGFVAMCSTQADTFGSEANQSEVPREPLIAALAKNGTVVRSDQFAASVGDRSIPPAVATPKLDRGTFVVGSCYVDYLL